MTKLSDVCKLSVGDHIERATSEDRSPSSVSVSESCGRRERDNNSSTDGNQPYIRMLRETHHARARATLDSEIVSRHPSPKQTWCSTSAAPIRSRERSKKKRGWRSHGTDLLGQAKTNRY